MNTMPFYIIVMDHLVQIAIYCYDLNETMFHVGGPVYGESWMENIGDDRRTYYLVIFNPETLITPKANSPISPGLVDWK